MGHISDVMDGSYSNPESCESPSEGGGRLGRILLLLF